MNDDWKKYLWRWTLFGFIGGGLQPVINSTDDFWTVKIWQCISGVPFGVVCAVAFIFLQNKFNKDREKIKTWAFIFSTWMSVKFLIAVILSAV